MRPYPGGPAALPKPAPDLKGGPGPGLRNSESAGASGPRKQPRKEGPQPLQKRHVSAPAYRRRGPGPRASRPPPSLPGPRSEHAPGSAKDPSLHPRPGLATHHRPRRARPVTQHSAAAPPRGRGLGRRESSDPARRGRDEGGPRPGRPPRLGTGVRTRPRRRPSASPPSPYLLHEVDGAFHRALALQHAHSLHLHDSRGRAPVRAPRAARAARAARTPRAAEDAAEDADANRVGRAACSYRPELRAPPTLAGNQSPPARSARSPRGVGTRVARSDRPGGGTKGPRGEPGVPRRRLPPPSGSETPRNVKLWKNSAFLFQAVDCSTRNWENEVYVARF